MHISIDFGNTLFDSRLPQIPFGLAEVLQPFVHAIETVEEIRRTGDRVSIISKISTGQASWVCACLFRVGLFPQLVAPCDLRFCLNREAKGQIAAALQPHVHIDDKVEALNAVHQIGRVPYKILFLGVGDDRQSSGKLCFDEQDGLLIAHDWFEVEAILRTLKAKLPAA